MNGRPNLQHKYHAWAWASCYTGKVELSHAEADIVCFYTPPGSLASSSIGGLTMPSDLPNIRHFAIAVQPGQLLGVRYLCLNCWAKHLQNIREWRPEMCVNGSDHVPVRDVHFMLADVRKFASRRVVKDYEGRWYAELPLGKLEAKEWLPDPGNLYDPRIAVQTALHLRSWSRNNQIIAGIRPPTNIRLLVPEEEIFGKVAGSKEDGEGPQN
ncbi:hypothetical protein QBC47DRAFT_32719 [Echria macrotheca]|uniref:Uncharacterized protein n=1 Tax=Echria macrotheca TaxID=438768 RepID=A0AAJ0F3X2_9PEZI|nr:hypothetical protein QBC47DRAFT_32719 [Echria macrotheca]